jgi:hypothetical protein
LYAGGEFTTAGSVTVSNNVAQWNGTSWAALGTGGFDANVSAMIVDSSGNLYAGGEFTTADGVSANSVAIWNGTSWAALPAGGVTARSGGWIVALAVDSGNTVYVGGSFTTVGDFIPASDIATWNGTNWATLGTGTDDAVYALAVDSSGNLYAGGSFTTAGGVPANYVAVWNGTSWVALGTGLNGGVGALAVDSSGNVLAGGSFTFAGSHDSGNFAEFQPCPGGLDYFTCYKVSRPFDFTLYPHFMPHKGVVLDDALDSSAPNDQHKVDVEVPAEACAPADTGGDPTAPSDAAHLETYLIVSSRLTPAQPRFRKSVHTIQNSLGELKLQLTGVSSLVVPSAEANGSGGAPPLGATNVDHFKCYTASVARAPVGQPPYPKFTPVAITMTDQFGGPLQLTLTKPTKLCLPANQDGSNPTAPLHSAHLVCYTAKLRLTTPAQPAFTRVMLSTNNVFGNEVLLATKRAEVCVPSHRLD